VYLRYEFISPKTCVVRHISQAALGLPFR
jgi:hypothetical protein